MTMALPARRAAVGMVAVAVPAVRTRPPRKETYYMMRRVEVPSNTTSVFAFLDECVCISTLTKRQSTPRRSERCRLSISCFILSRLPVATGQALPYQCYSIWSTQSSAVYVYICISLPAAVNATLTGSMMGAGAPETERRQHARARTTKP